MRILFIGDIFGNLGRKVLKKYLGNIKRENNIDFCIANGENAAAGRGITYAIASDLYNMGVDCITLGNHTWGKSDIVDFIDDDLKMVRPANYPEELPGKGSRVITNQNNEKIGVINVLGRVYMEGIDCPFKAIEREISYLRQFVNVIIVDVHAEATSEKCAISWDFDGKVSAILGTHTHVQTADDRIMPNGTAFLTDVGMTGPYNGIIGVDRNIILRKFKTYMPQRFEPATGKAQINAVIVDVNKETGIATNIKRINLKNLDIK